MSSPRLERASAVGEEALDAFLRRFFTPAKASLLRDHGAWWHRGDENRVAVTVGGEVAGYCAVIPTRCRVAGAVREAVWWVDLVVAPEHRGRGLQRLFDDWVRSRAPLVLGFPNALAARIHRRHGWGVREDLRVLMAPLRPLWAPALRRRGGAGPLRRAVAIAITPPAALLRGRVRTAAPGRAWELTEPTAESLAEVYARHHRSGASGTTHRDAAHLSWRYLGTPHRAQLRFFAAGDPGAPRLILVTRLVGDGDAPRARVLDLFGDLDDARLLRDLVRLGLRSALADGAVQVTAMAASRELAVRLRRAGFVLPARARFCWLSGEPAVASALAGGDPHWVIGDSDNDEP